MAKPWNLSERRRSIGMLLAAALLAIAVGGSPAAGAEDLTPGITRLKEKWTGDFDGMVKDKVVRALVVYSKTFYFLDGATQRGLSYDALQAFEKFINEQQKTKTIKIKVIITPVSRDGLLPALVEGRGDIAVANLTITDERRRLEVFGRSPRCC